MTPASLLVRRLLPRSLVRRAALTWVGVIVVLGITVGPLLPTGPAEVGFHVLGQDHLGRDVAMRLVGGTTGVAVPYLVALVVVGLSVAVSATSSWLGGPARALFGMLVGAVGAVPRFVWVLLALSVYGRELGVFGLATGLAFLPSIHAVLDARIARWEHRPKVQAELAHGVPRWRVLWGHLVLWESGPALFRTAVLLFGYTLVLEATLAYLGFGVGEPRPSWGNAIAFDWGHAEVGWPGRLAPIAVVWLTAGAAVLGAGSDAAPEAS